MRKSVSHAQVAATGVMIAALLILVVPPTALAGELVPAQRAQMPSGKLTNPTVSQTPSTQVGYPTVSRVPSTPVINPMVSQIQPTVVKKAPVKKAPAKKIVPKPKPKKKGDPFLEILLPILAGVAVALLLISLI